MGLDKTKPKASFDDCETSPMGVGQSCIWNHHEEHRGRKFTPLCTELVCNLKSYVTPHLRSEGNTCQLDRFVIRLNVTIYMCVLKNIKHFTNRKGLLLLVGDWAKKEHFDQSMTCLEVSTQSPTVVH